MNPTANPIAPDIITIRHPLVERFFSVDVELFKRQLADLESEIAPDVIPERNDPFHCRILKAFRDSQEACRHFENECEDRAVVQDVQTQFRGETDQWFRHSWIAHRARTKPSGFAGDYEMLLKLYAEATPARGLGGYLDLCILDLPLARAVRARLVAAKEFLIGEVASRTGDVRVLDIACGPCHEYRDWPEFGAGRGIEIVAMDSDPNALTYIEETFGQQLTTETNLRAVRYNALRTRSAAATARKFGKFDILYSVGLCDYLSDEHLIGMLAAWRDTLNDGGVLYVAFKDSERYHQTPYQWHLDWFFFQRTRQDLLRLFENAGFDVDGIETTRDDTGIIINWIDRRPGTTRIDAAHTILPHGLQSVGGGSVPKVGAMKPDA